MQIIDRSKSEPMDRSVRLRTAGGEASFDIPAEHTVQVYVNEQHAMQIVCTPGDTDELVVGRLLSEGFVRCAEDIRKLYICNRGLICRVWLRDGAVMPRSDAQAASIGTCCTDNRIYVERRYEDLGRVPRAVWREEWLFRCAAQLREGDPLYAMTHAVHACYLCREGEILCVREDIGRHNALDKAIGYGAMSGLDPAGCFLFTTGRLPADMVSKAVRAGIPLLASKTFPTERGAALAKKSGLTLVTVRDEKRLIIWSDGEDETD